MKKLLPFLFLILFMQGMLQAQFSWLPMDEAPANNPLTLLVDQGNIYTLGFEKYIGYKNGALAMKKWNGLFWADMPKYPVQKLKVTNDNHVALCQHLGKMYAGASFMDLDGKSGGLVRWNGTLWEPLGEGLTSDYVIYPEISVENLTSYKNELFVCGEFNQTTRNKSLQNLASYEADTWRSFNTGYGSFHDMYKWNDTLLIAGNFMSIDGVFSPNIITYFNRSFKKFPVTFSAEILKLTEFNNAICAVSSNGVSILNGNKWNPLASNWNHQVLEVSGSAENKGKLWLSGRFKNASNAVYTLAIWDGNKWDFQFPEAEMTLNTGNKNLLALAGNDFYFGSGIQKIKTENANGFIKLLPGRVILKGFVYRDQNADCSHDALDVGVGNIIFSLNNGSYYTSSDENGFYSMDLPLNENITITIYPDNGWESSCTPAEKIFLTASAETTYAWDYPLKRSPAPPAEDLVISSSSGFTARHGYTAFYKIIPKNIETFPAKIELNYNPDLNDFHSDVAYTIESSGKVVWNLDQPEEIHFDLLISAGKFKPGDEMIFKAKMVSAHAESSSALRQTVVAAHDPNFKDADKKTLGTSDKTLNYFIQFQNLGDDSAVNIHVVDTISNSLPMQFIQVSDYSHKNSYSIGFRVRDHAIIWGFNKIMLPPKAIAGDEASSGYISFIAGLTNDLKPGNRISNQAYIYFDYQPPVATNNVISEVKNAPQANDSAESLILYPNPSNGLVQVQLQHSLIQKINIYDRNGKRVIETDANNKNGTLIIDMSGLSSGVYFLKAEYATGVIGKKLIISK